jgi:hypothetical protein
VSDHDVSPSCSLLVVSRAQAPVVIS